MTKITKKKVIELSIVFERDFTGGDALGQSSVVLQPIIPPSHPQQVLVYNTFTFSFKSLSNDFELQAKIVMMAKFEDKYQIEKQDLFETVVMCEKHLQSIIDAAFSLQNPPTVAPIEYNEIEDKLDEHIQALRQ